MPTTYEIHPGIGIARVGTSQQSFLGPEPGGTAPANYRDAAGDLLRQAARFRVFRCDRAADGTLRSASEVTPAEGRVEWTVHLVNAKGAAPEFPPVASRPAGVRLRNAGHANRADLVVDPGPRTVSGPGQRAVFDSGTFLGTPVPLGEISCDADGRLLVLGGFGSSGSVPRGSVPIGNFANNDKWYDDMSDGTVAASLTLAGARGGAVTVRPARVIVAPPDFAPGVANLVTLYDVAFQAAVERGWRRLPAQPSFSLDVQPLLQRAVGYQWVLQLGRQGHAHGSGMGDFAGQWAALADPSPANAFLRGGVLAALRDPTQPVTNANTGLMPRLHNSDYVAFPSAVLRLTPSQYAVMQQWAAGRFVGDLGHPPAVAELLPDALDRTALQACSGGPFFPGIEVGRVMADPLTYSAAFCVDPTSHAAGQLTAGNAVPWQADFLACSVDAQPQLGWWPAQRPYQVFTKGEATTTQFWHRGVTGFRGMVDEWHRLGVVVETRRSDGTTVFVESERQPLKG